MGPRQGFGLTLQCRVSVGVHGKLDGAAPREGPRHSGMDASLHEVSQLGCPAKSGKPAYLPDESPYSIPAAVKPWRSTSAVWSNEGTL